MDTTSLHRDDKTIVIGLRRFLRTGTRSVREVQEYLERHGIRGEATRRALARCRAHGWVDDGGAARLLADHWARRGYAWRAIQEKLTRKGFDAYIVHELSRTLGTTAQDEARACEVVEAAGRRGPRPVSRVARLGRMGRLLARRGFDADVIDRVLQESFGLLPAE